MEVLNQGNNLISPNLNDYDPSVGESSPASPRRYHEKAATESPLPPSVQELKGTKNLKELIHPSSNDVLTTLKYYDAPSSGFSPAPIIISSNTITNTRTHTTHPFTIIDISPSPKKHTLSTHGFQYLHYPTSLRAFTSPSIEEIYYPECISLIKTLTGASHVHIFNHKLRHGPTHWHHLGLSHRGPVMKVHIDTSYHGASLRLLHSLPDLAPSILANNTRYQILNIWRPLKKVTKDPLAVCDCTSVKEEDLVSAGFVEDGFAGEQWIVRFNQGHRWYFKYEMEKEEAVVFKCFDSQGEGVRGVPHSSFEDERFVDGERRESIEVRCLVVYDEGMGAERTETGRRSGT